MTAPAVPPGPVRDVAALSTGRVKIHPQHVRGSRLPSLAWILLSPTWGAWRRSTSLSSSTSTASSSSTLARTEPRSPTGTTTRRRPSCASSTVGSPISRSDPTRPCRRNWTPGPSSAGRALGRALAPPSGPHRRAPRADRRPVRRERHRMGRHGGTECGDGRLPTPPHRPARGDLGQGHVRADHRLGARALHLRARPPR